MITALLLDLANIAGGFLLAVGLLQRLPRAGHHLAAFAARAAAFGWVVGIVALAMGGYYVLVHLVSGPHLFVFEVVGVCVGLALLWDRLTGRGQLPRPGQDAVTGLNLVLAVFGIIAIVVGLQGLFTPDG